MSQTVWWEEPLSAFSQAFGTECEVLRDPRTTVRSVGEWWIRDGHWHVQLDRVAYARFAEVDALHDAARRLMSSALASGYASSSKEASWQEILTRHFSELLRQAHQAGDVTTQADFEKQTEAQFVQRMSIRELELPGYFACIEFTSIGREAEELHALVEDILAEFEPTAFLGWTTHPRNLQSALVFVSHNLVLQSVLQDDVESDGSEDRNEDRQNNVARSQTEGGRYEFLPSAAMTNAAGVPSFVRDFFATLLGTLESEAMAAAKATVGHIVRHSKEWHAGLSSVIQAWREHYRFVPEESVYIWGQKPILFLLSALPQEAVREFIRMVSLTHSEDEGEKRTSRFGDHPGSDRPSSERINRDHADILLPAELAETLDGFLRANLNVSEASRILYLHRNTLMNRLDRIRMQTGYDVRHFDDALILWITQSLLGSS